MMAEDVVLTPAMRLRWGNEMYLILFLCATPFSYSPRVVLWTGIAAAVAWSVGTVWIIALPASRVFPADATMSFEEIRLAISDPNHVDIGAWARQILVLLLVSVALAAFVARARRLVVRQAETERARANLSRYFSANMVDELAQSDEPLRTPRTLDCAVLFVDIVGFTGLSSAHPPAAVMGLLREFHGRMARAVFEHSGTLDKYIGDAVMATFGTPRVGPNDASNALGCAKAMSSSIGAWNAERAQEHKAPVRVGIGLHYGPVVVGDIGGEQRLEFAVIGDTVNVASRLERLTRELSAVVLASGDLMDAVRREVADAEAALTGFTDAGARPIRGRDGEIRVWALLPDPGPGL